MIVLKSKSEIALMREAGRINALVLAELREAVHPGVTTAELDALAISVQQKLGAGPVFQGYRPHSGPPFPAVITTCVNEELVHGIPGERVLEDGDLLTVDCASNYQGYIGDAAFSVGVGGGTEAVAQLIGVTEEALAVGIAAAQPDSRVGDIGAAIQTFVESKGYSVVRGYGGHGVGRTMHEEPHIPNVGPSGRGRRLRPGMTIAIEPMVLAGDHEVITLADQWTVVSKDGKLTAHCEHTIVVTENGPEILTLL
jgi:methionyl aminopeptidase